MDYTNYTYDDFLRAAQDAGLYGNFSQYDLSLAQQNPGAGMQILAAKQQWQNAQTEADRLAANAAAEQIRSQYGSYLGGADGSEYNPFGSTQSSFSGTQSGYTSGAEGNTVNNWWNAVQNYPDYQMGQSPTYNNRLDADIMSGVYGIVNYPDFAYDAASDPLYAQYRKQYLREGKRAAEDTMGAAAAMSGGIPSSYAATAAGQAQNYYNAQLTDKIPELYQIAYNKYLNDFQMQQSKLATLQQQEQYDWEKYLNELGQWNTENNFKYNAYMDKYNMLANNLQTAQGLEETKYSRYLDDLNEQYNRAQLAASAGDLSYLQAMGIDTSNWWTLNGPKASGGGGGGGSGNGNGNGEFQTARERVYSAGYTNYADALDWLMDNGYGVSAAKAVLGSQEEWDSWVKGKKYAERNAQTQQDVKQYGSNADTRGFRQGRLDSLIAELSQLNDPSVIYNRILYLADSGQITQPQDWDNLDGSSEMEILMNSLIPNYEPPASAGTRDRYRNDDGEWSRSGTTKPGRT